MIPEINIARVVGGYIIRVAGSSGNPELHVCTQFAEVVKLVDRALHPEPTDKPF